MIFDTENVLARRQVISGTSETPRQHHAPRGASWGASATAMTLCVIVEAGMTGADGSLVVRYQTAAGDQFTNPTTVITSLPQPQAALVRGATFNVPLTGTALPAEYSRVTFQLSGVAPSVTLTALVLPSSLVPALHQLPPADFPRPGPMGWARPDLFVDEYDGFPSE